MRRGPKKFARREPFKRVGSAIQAPELRVLSEDGENLGVLSREDALTKAREMELDLIEVSPGATPPVAKIMDYGKYRYEEKKKDRDTRAKANTPEVKNVQVKIGTGEHDLEMKAKRASEWIAEGHRVKVELYLRGRARFLDKDFLDERLKRFLKLITEEYKIADPPKQSPKGVMLTIVKA